jgi:lysophospholipase L1-like esterase
VGRVARRLGYAAIPLAVVVGGSEVALRAAGWPTVTDARRFAHMQVYWTEPPDQVAVAHPHKETSGSFTVTSDANGLRAAGMPPHPVAKGSTPRVMTLGCSTTFGWGVDDAQTYPARLEARLREGGHPAEVINGGQPGYTSFQGLWLWDKTLAQYRPDVVVWGYLVQDARRVAYSDRSQAVLQQNAEFLKQNLLYRLRLYVGLKALLDDVRIEAKEDAGPEGGVYRVPPEEYVANLRAFKARTDAIGARLVLFGFPLERAGYTEEHRRILAAAAKVLEVPLHDPQPRFEELTRTEQLYFPQDRGHANAAGLDRIAESVAGFLVEQGLVK